MNALRLSGCVLLVVLVVGAGAQAAESVSDEPQEPERAIAQVQASAELRQVQLEALRLELESFSDPLLAAAQAVRLIADWGIQSDDPGPAAAALKSIASAAEGTPVRPFALGHLARLLAEKERYEEAAVVLATVATEAAEHIRQREAEVREASAAARRRERSLRQRDAELTARSRKLQEDTQRLREYARQLKREAARLKVQAHSQGPERRPAGHQPDQPSPAPTREQEP